MCRIGLARKEARAGKHDGLYHRFTLPGPTLTIGIQHRRQRPCCGPSTLDECWFCYHGYSIAIDPHLMLIICNGAMKSGSSWFCHMLLLIAEPEPIPKISRKRPGTPRRLLKMDWSSFWSWWTFATHTTYLRVIGRPIRKSPASWSRICSTGTTSPSSTTIVT